MVQKLFENVGQAACLAFRAASCRRKPGARLPRQPSGWKPDRHFQRRSQPEPCR